VLSVAVQNPPPTQAISPRSISRISVIAVIMVISFRSSALRSVSRPAREEQTAPDTVRCTTSVQNVVQRRAHLTDARLDMTTPKE
jgi:hypothetical protein